MSNKMTRANSKAKSDENPLAVTRTVGRLDKRIADQDVSTLDKINKLSVQAANSLGLTVLNIHLGGQGKQKNLEICIYKQESAVNFADCEAMSRGLEQLIEVEERRGSELISGSFTISIVSPGIERRLTNATEFMLFAGKPVRISTKEKINGLGIEFIAVLISGDEQSITVSQTKPLSSKQNGKKKLVSQSGQELTLALSQVYGIYLYPGKQ